MPDQEPDPQRTGPADATTSDEQFAGARPITARPARVSLRHSPLHVPHDRLTVTSLDEREAHHGVAFTATLCLDGAAVGVILNEGNGGQTWLRHHDPTRFSWRDLHEFVRGCRYRHQHTDEETVLDRLVTEYDLARQLAALPPNWTMARTVNADGDFCGDIVTVESDALDLFDRPGGRAGLAIYLAGLTTGSCCVGWQVWLRDAWQRVPALIAAESTYRPGDDHVRPDAFHGSQAEIARKTRDARERRAASARMRLTEMVAWLRETASDESTVPSRDQRDELLRVADWIESAIPIPYEPHPDPTPPPCSGERWSRVLEAVRTAGRRDGEQAAAWWAQHTIGGRSHGDTTAVARTVAAGIDAGDPAVLDALPVFDVAGYDAERYRVQAPDDAPDWDNLSDAERAAAIDAARDGFTTAVEHTVAKHCAALLDDGTAPAQ
ncbi:hypothetical protein [Micromonospora sp. NPDC047134]|uniref:hypothetical protein n=1 Tax=Micromonospora sp. NPDC047134 TaxID=3154340 RepID=UPI0033C455E6